MEKNIMLYIYMSTQPTPVKPIATTFKKYALVVSISDYLYIGDLSFCDEDAISWCDFLTQQEYSIILLGDKTSTYGKYKLNDFATEANIRKYMLNISQKVKPGDQFVFVSSGHGSGDGKGNSFICCLDMTNSPNGQYTDVELASDIKLFTNKKTKVILFFDNCLSGGLIQEVVAQNPQMVCAIATCSAKGCGFDVEEYKHGAWTYFFLVNTLQKNPTFTIDQAFSNAIVGYPFKECHFPECSGNKTLKF
jgi:hypothetical protein